MGAQDSSQVAMAASAQGSGSMTGSSSGSELRSLIVQKEKELDDMNEYRIQVRCTRPSAACYSESKLASQLIQAQRHKPTHNTHEFSFVRINVCRARTSGDTLVLHAPYQDEIRAPDFDPICPAISLDRPELRSLFSGQLAVFMQVGAQGTKSAYST